MNKRILELANEAGFYVRHDKGEILIPTISEDITQWQIKFAELMIKECTEHISSIHNGNFYALGDELKQHFGVE